MSWRDQLFSTSAVRDEERLSDGEVDPNQEPLLDGEVDIAEKIIQVTHYLKRVDDYDAVTYRELRTYVGVDLWRDEELLERLETKNPNVFVDRDTRTLNYVTAIGVKKKEDLPTQLDLHRSGVLLSELKEESYSGVEYDVAKLVHTGKVLAVNGREISKTLLYPRYKQNLIIELPGSVSVAKGSRFIRTDCDLRDFIRRGDLIIIGRTSSKAASSSTSSSSSSSSSSSAAASSSSVEVNSNGGHSFRVSTASLEGMHANWHCQLNAASSSAPATATIPARCFPFTASVLPLDEIYQGPTLKDVKAERFGCTSLHRRVWDEVEKMEAENPCANQIKDKHGTLISAIDKCRELGLVKDEKVFEVALGSTGAIESRRKTGPKGRGKGGGGKKRMRLAPRRNGRQNKKGKSDTAHLRKDPKYRALMASMEN